MTDQAGDSKARPGATKRTTAIIDTILDGLAEGIPLAALCRQPGMPCVTTVWNWEKADPELAESIARAREAGEEWLAAECLEIADDARNDWMERNQQGGATGPMVNSEHIQRSKLRIDTRLKLLAKFNPRRWGEKVLHADADGEKMVPPTITVEFVNPANG